MTPRNPNTEASQSENSFSAIASERARNILTKGTVTAMALLAIAGCTPKGDVTPTSNPSPTKTEQTDPTTSSTPEVSPTGGEVDYSLSGAERDEFIKSLEIPASGDATAVGKKFVENFNTWANIGANDDVFNIYLNDIPAEVPVIVFAGQYADSWKDEFATMFDENSENYDRLVNAYGDISITPTGGYLTTIRNGNANAVYQSKETFVNAEEQAATDSGDRVISIAFHATDNAGDTGVVEDSDGGNTDRQGTVTVTFKQYGDILKIVDIQA